MTEQEFETHRRALHRVISWGGALLLTVIIAQTGIMMSMLREHQVALKDVKIEQATCAARLSAIIERNHVADDRQTSMERLLQKHDAESR